MTKLDQHTLAKQEYQNKLSIKKKLAKYYFQQARKNGLSDLEKIKAYLPKQYTFRQIERDIIFSHLDLEPILELIADEKEFSVISGLNPSSSLHLGHKALFDILFELQKLGGRIFIPLTNDESYLDGKASSLTESKDIAVNKVLPQIAAFNFDSKRTQFFIDTDYRDLYVFAMKISKHITLAMLKQVFGDEALINVGQIFYRGAVQVAQILLPQLPEFGGPKHTLISVGIDQHPYVLLARDVAKKMGMIPPSELVMKFQPSLLDPEQKMSGSKPDTAIYLSDSEAAIKKKINRAYTGAVSSLEIHQELGGIPEICSVFALFNYHYPDSLFISELEENYRKGTIAMNDLKQRAVNFVVDLAQAHQKRVISANGTQFLLKTKITSVTN